tara:strand:+ start:717 stop:1451 length:735 start_codon:yes stop_codon:yes gene_type:complete
MLGIGLSLTGLSVRRGGAAWTPMDMGASLLAWWDASQGLTLSGSQATAWADRKNGYSAVQATGAAQPTADGTWLTFDGTDDFLNMESQPFPSGSAGAEIWAVVQQDSPVANTTARHVAGYGAAVAAGRRAMVRAVLSGVNRANIQFGDGSGNVSVSGTAVDLSSRHVLRTRFMPTEGRVSVDGNAESIAAGIPNTGTTRVTIGGSTSLFGNHWHGKIRDVIVTGPLSTDQAALLHAFLLPRRAL